MRIARAHAACPPFAASCSAVRPRRHRASGSAPRDNSASTTPACPVIAATCKGRRPSSSTIPFTDPGSSLAMRNAPAASPRPHRFASAAAAAELAPSPSNAALAVDVTAPRRRSKPSSARTTRPRCVGGDDTGTSGADVRIDGASGFKTVTSAFARLARASSSRARIDREERRGRWFPSTSRDRARASFGRAGAARPDARSALARRHSRARHRRRLSRETTRERRRWRATRAGGNVRGARRPRVARRRRRRRWRSHR